MGILGIGGVEVPISKSNRTWRTASDSSTSSSVFSNQHAAAPMKKTRTFPLSDTETRAIARAVIEEDTARTSILSNIVNGIKNFFGQRTQSAKEKFTGMKRNAVFKIEQILTTMKQNLLMQGINFDELEEEDKVRYLAMLASYDNGNISNEEFVDEMTEIQKNRTTREIRKQDSNLYQFVSFIKDRFTPFFENSGKIDNATITTAMATAPQEISQQLMLLYANTTEERRGEILSEAFKALPKGINQEAILAFATASESYSEAQYKYSKMLIQSSNLPDSIKAKYLAKLEDDKARRKEFTKSIVEKFIQQTQNQAYKIIKDKLNSNELKYDELQSQQQKLNKKIDEAKTQRAKALDQRYYNKVKIKNLKEKAKEEFEKNQKITHKIKADYNEAKNQEKELRVQIYAMDKEINTFDNQWMNILSARKDIISSNQKCINEITKGTVLSTEQLKLSDVNIFANIAQAIF